MGILDAAVTNGYAGVSGWLLSTSGWSGRKEKKTGIGDSEVSHFPG